MKSPWVIQVGLPKTNVLTRERTGKLETGRREGTDTEEKSTEAGGRDGSGACTSQGLPGVPGGRTR